MAERAARSGLSRGLLTLCGSNPRRGLVKNIARGLNPNGEKDVLALWIAPSSSCRSLRAAHAGDGRRP